MKKHYVCSAPLFDQLTENSNFVSEFSNIKILLTSEALLDSIILELSDIFGTRSSFSSEKMNELIEEVGKDNEYLLSGIPGFLGLPTMKNIFVEGTPDCAEFERKCELMIELYEPRLQDPSVKVATFDQNTQSLKINITGQLINGELRENVSFPIEVEAGGNT